jgi:hypothetical protein
MSEKPKAPPAPPAPPTGLPEAAKVAAKKTPPAKNPPPAKPAPATPAPAPEPETKPAAPSVDAGFLAQAGRFTNDMKKALGYTE